MIISEHKILPNEIKISEYKILESAAGFYIGRTYTNPEIQGEFPYDRISEYYETQEELEATRNRE